MTLLGVKDSILKYHFIPRPRHLDPSLDKEARARINELTSEMETTLKKLAKKEPNQHFKKLGYLFDPENIHNLKKGLTDNDELIIHAEGYPFMISPVDESHAYQLTPFQLAAHLDAQRFPDLNVTINLLTCNSATQYEGSNFACDLSNALHKFFRYKNLRVVGYTGFIHVKSNAKYTVSGVLGRSTKGTHASLEDATLMYHNGAIIVQNKLLINDLSNIIFSWASPNIKQLQHERRLVAAITKEKPHAPCLQIRSLSNEHFFAPKPSAPATPHTNQARSHYPLRQSNSSDSFFPNDPEERATTASYKNLS